MDAQMTYDLKKEPADSAYVKLLTDMTPEARLRQALELSDFTRALFRQGLQARFPDLSGENFEHLYLERIELCHNRNY